MRLPDGLPRADRDVIRDLFLPAARMHGGFPGPSAPIGHNTPQNGSGDFGVFVMGTGGQCATNLPGAYDPPYGTQNVERKELHFIFI